jgi:putative ABC transport system substrate-binding protein
MRSLLSLILIAVVLALGNIPVIAQPQLPKIGLITAGAGAGAGRNREALLQGLEELGYVNGKTILIEHRYYKGKRNLIHQIAAELVRLKVDVIVPSGPTALRPTMGVTKTTPIVMPNGGNDPVRSGFVRSLTRPGGNVTGLSMGTKGLGSKRMELLMEVLPSIRRVVYLNPNRRPVYLDEYKNVTRELGVELEVVDIRRGSDFEQAFANITTMGPDALIIERNVVTLRNRGQIGDFILKNRLPTMGGHRIFVEIGGLISYGVLCRQNPQRG